MRELAYERSLRSWMEAREMRWSRGLYAREPGGQVVSYRLSPAGAPRAVAMPVHGAGNDALFSLPGLIKRLLLADYEVFAFDLDGHGRASTTRFDPETIGGAVAAAAAESGAASRGLPLHGIGISLGGSLLLGAMASDPGRFATAALMVAPISLRLSPAAVRGELRLSALRTLWREREHCGIWGMVPAFGPVKRGIYPLRLAEAPGEGAFGYVQVLDRALARVDPKHAAAAVRTPTLLAYGEADRIVPISQGESLHRVIRGSALVRVAGGTHLTTPLAPEVTDRLLGWIGARPAAETHVDTAAR